MIYYKRFYLYFLYICFLGCDNSDLRNVSNKDWSAANGNDFITRFSTLKEINRSNVKNLDIAWIYKSGEVGNVQCNPLIKDGIVYITTANQSLLALNGKNGELVWRFSPSDRSGETFRSKNRGLALWSNGKDERILYTTGGYLNCIDIKTGKPYEEFGNRGRVNLNEGLVRAPDKMGITSPAAPVIFKDLVIVGAMSWTAPANVSAFNINTGERVWVFNTIPHPDEHGYDSWGDREFWKNGAGANVWGGLSVDPINEMVYFGTGQPKNDFYRPNNKGSHLFGNSVIALKASTGERVWHYQVIRRDIWDLDLPYPPILADLDIEGEVVPSAIQLTKTGNIFMFNRLNGNMLSKVTEVEVPNTKLEGASVYPTQPKVTWPEPFSRQVVKRDELTNLSPAKRDSAERVFNDSDVGWFIPPSEKGILYYGIHGGAEWSGAAIDPFQNILYVSANELAWLIKMEKIEKKEPLGKRLYSNYGCINCHGSDRKGGINDAPSLMNLDSIYNQSSLAKLIANGKGSMPAIALEEGEMKALTTYLLKMETPLDSTGKFMGYRSMGYNKFLDADGYPATKPPWGTLSAVDLTKGEIIWQVPLGEYHELNERGIPTTGTENFGGCVVTAGGLLFVAGTRDEKIRAFDTSSGKIMWEYKLPFGGYATPSVYEVDGKQYLVIAATGGGKLGTKTGDAVVAFSLPQ